MAMAAARRALLNQPPRAGGSPSGSGKRPVARLLSSTTEVEKGSFLDKGEVADRVVSVIKNFQEIEPSKVTPNAHFQKDLGSACAPATDKDHSICVLNPIILN